MKKVYTIDGSSVKMEDYKKTSKNSGNTTCEFYMHHDEDTGMLVKRIIFKEGSVTPWHYHHCAHGIYVLSGTLVTDQGSFGKDSFVWWEEGTRGYHGAEVGDCEGVFITNKPFDIVYLEQEELLPEEDLKYVIHHPE